jgi:6-phosphogluconolactonase (cycloisomerase 2 family)
LLFLLAGCGGSAPKTVYEVGLGTPDVVSFTVSSKGALTLAKETSTGGTPTAIAFDPQRRFAFVTNSAGPVLAGGVSQYTVGGNTLTPNTTMVTTNTGQSTATTPPAPAGVDPVAMVIDAKGAFAFVANQVSNTISVYSIDRSTGVLTEVKGADPAHSSPFATAAGPSGLAVSGNTLFVANQTARVVSVYTFDATTGVLTAGAQVPAGVRPTALDVDPTGKFLYVTDAGANAVLGFSISSGALTAMTSSFPAGTAPVAVKVYKTTVYVANSGSGNVSAFTIGSAGALTAVEGSPFAAGTNPSYVVADSSLKFLFVANQGSNDISVFGIGSNGGLLQVTGSPFAAGAVGSPVGLASIN